MTTTTSAACLAALALLGGASAFEVKKYYEEMRSFSFHHKLQTGAGMPMLVAFLNESSPDYVEQEFAFNLAAADFHCLAPPAPEDADHAGGGVHVMFAGVEDRAKFIIKDDGITLPGLSFFKDGARVNYGGEWTAFELRAWVYESAAQMTILHDAEGLEAFKSSKDRTAVGHVSKLCDDDSVQLVAGISSYRSAKGGPSGIPFAVTTDNELAADLGVSGSSGLVVSTGRGKSTQLQYPSHQAFASKALQQWLSGVISSGSAEAPTVAAAAAAAAPKEPVDPRDIKREL